MNVHCYYHYYHGSSSLSIFLHHLQILDQCQLASFHIAFINTPPSIQQLVKDSLSRFTSRMTSFDINSKQSNEFLTLAELQADLPLYQPNDWLLYCHTKGARHGHNSYPAKVGIQHLINIESSLRIFRENLYLSQLFVCIGSELSIGNFSEFGPPVLHYSGNIWCSRVDYLSSLPVIHSSYGEHYSLRYDAEGWIGQTNEPLRPLFFNASATYLSHYQISAVLQSAPCLLSSSRLNHLSKEEAFHLSSHIQSIYTSLCQSLDSHLNRTSLLSFRRSLRQHLIKYLTRYPTLFQFIFSLLYRLTILKGRNRLLCLPLPDTASVANTLWPHGIYTN